jgi:hypothetical protein
MEALPVRIARPSRAGTPRAYRVLIWAAIAMLGLVGLGLTLRAAPAPAAFSGQNGFILFATDAYTGPRFDKSYNYNLWKLDPHRYNWGKEWVSKAEINSGAVVQLTDDNLDQVSPSFSPDGRKIVYGEIRGRDQEIMLMNADGSNKKRLTTNGRQDRQPVFSPDGKRIAFASSRSGETEIWVMRADGAGEKRLTTFSSIDKTTGQSANPQFSPDGSVVVFQGTTYAQVPWGQDALYRVDSDVVDPQHPVRIVNLYGVYRMRGFAFDATGTRVIYSVSESRALRIRDELITGQGLPDLRAFDPNWAPYNLHQSVGDGGCGLCAGAWAGDKLRLFPGKQVVPVDDRKYPNDPGYGFPAVSPAGDRLVYQWLGREPGVGRGAPLVVVEGFGTVLWEDATPGGQGHWAVKQPDWGPQTPPL